jgi:hypothetical protein
MDIEAVSAGWSAPRRRVVQGLLEGRTWAEMGVSFETVRRTLAALRKALEVWNA